MSKGRKHNKKEQNNLMEKRSPKDTLSIMGGLFFNEVHMELVNNTEAIIEGCTGILEYNTDTIRVNTEKYIIQFKGRSLTLRCMTQDSIIVNGYFLSIEFLV